MKKIAFTFLLAAFCISANLHAQIASGVPQKFAYSSQVRDANQELLVNRFINLRFSLHSASATGPVVYAETDTVTTSPMGIFTVVIGGGSIAVGRFEQIDWKAGDMFLQIELDANGGTNFVDMGAAQIISSPYAIAAGNGLSSVKYDSTGSVVIQTADSKTTTSTTASWLTTGNKGISSTGFIGTTDNTDLVLKRMNAEGLRLGANNAVTMPGNLGLGVASPVTSLDVNGGVTLRDTTINVGGNFTLAVGNHALIFINSDVSAATTCTLADGLQRGQIVILSITGTKGVNFVNNAPRNNTRVNVDGKGVGSSIGGSAYYTEGNSITFMWDGTDWRQLSGSITKP